MSSQPPGGFFSALFDFSFSQFITTRLIPILYGLALVVGAVMALFYLVVGFRFGFGMGILAIIVVPICYVLYAMYLRVLLEVLIVVFRISEDVGEIAARGRTSPSA